jgi:serine/threonine protein kinase
MNPAKRIEQATQLIQRLAGILAPLHRLDPAIVHRDLKPANILMVRKESGKYDVKIGDFGIGGVSARQALAGASRGVSRGDLLSQSLRGSHTPLYASDEQMGGNDPDPRDDVHALGVMWFQMLVGDLSRRAGSDLDEELRELKVPEKLIRLVKLCVARAGRRWANAGELAENIGHLLGNDPARDVQEEEHEWDVSKLERRQSEEKLPDGEDLGVQDPENGTAGGGTITSSVGKYGLAAIRAMELVKKGLVSSPIEAWERAVTEVFPHRPASQKKGCPRGTFLGLCEDGLIKGIRRGNYTGSEKNKGYALAAVSKLRDNPSLAHDPTQLWAMVAGKKTPNHQMDVVISLWNNGLIVTPG